MKVKQVGERREKFHGEQEQQELYVCVERRILYTYREPRALIYTARTKPGRALLNRRTVSRPMYAYRVRSVRIRLAETGAKEIVHDQRGTVFQRSFSLSLFLSARVRAALRFVM